MVLKLDGKSEIGAHVGAISVIWYDEGIWSDKEQSKNCFFLFERTYLQKLFL